MTIPYADLRERWRAEPEFRKEFEALRPEFRRARKLIEARTNANLSQGALVAFTGARQPPSKPQDNE